jgi:hypothetical protein
LNDFSRTDFAGGARNDPADFGVIEIRGKVQGLGEEAITEQNAQGISPAGVDGGLGPSPFGFIHDVVMDKRCDMDELDDYGQIDVAGANAASGSTAQERHQRSQAFSAAPDRIRDVTLDRRIERGRLLRNAGFDFLELGLDGQRDPGQSAIARD